MAWALTALSFPHQLQKMTCGCSAGWGAAFWNVPGVTGGAPAPPVVVAGPATVVPGCPGAETGRLGAWPAYAKSAGRSANGRIGSLRCVETGQFEKAKIKKKTHVTNTLRKSRISRIWKFARPTGTDTVASPMKTVRTSTASKTILTSHKNTGARGTSIHLDE
jgi:hypothetical protein